MMAGEEEKMTELYPLKVLEDCYRVVKWKREEKRTQTFNWEELSCPATTAAI